jgi:hypothetical protein
MAKHNKKRNVGLLHEQLVRHASENLVDGNKEKAELAINILQHRFKDRSELRREFRLFNALIHTKVPNREIAKQIITESRIACRNHDANRLRAEKSHLIKEINHDLDEEDFYRRKIGKYRLFATVQALLNEWRGAQRLGPDEIVKYENVLEEWLVRNNTDDELEKTVHADPLTLKIMTEKFNKKYDLLLNSEQKEMMENCLTGDGKELARQVGLIKERAVVALERFYHQCDNKILLEKREQLEERVSALEPTSTDESISRALVVSALIKELEGDDE